MNDSKKKGDSRSTLHEDEIVTQPSVGRRSALASIGFGALGAIGALAAAVGLKPETAEAQGCTDNDGGPYGDQPGYGRRCGYVVQDRPACTDNDSGAYADAAGRGRRCGY